jgi:hypothetical protein
MRKNHNYISKKNLFIALFFLPGYLCCQPVVPDSLYIDLDKIATYQSIRTKTEGAYLPSSSPLEGSYAGLTFKGGASLRDIPAKYINHKLILRFYAVNHSDEIDSVWFFPSFFYSSIQLYRIIGDNLRIIPNVKPPFDDSIGYRLLTLGPHDSSAFLAEMDFVKTYTNSIRPRLIHKTHLSTFIFDISSTHLYVNIVTYIFCGLIVDDDSFFNCQLFTGRFK